MSDTSALLAVRITALPATLAPMLLWLCMAPLGLPVVPLAPMLGEAEYRYFLEDSGARVGFVGGEQYAPLKAAGLGHAVLADLTAGTTQPLPAGLDTAPQLAEGDVACVCNRCSRSQGRIRNAFVPGVDFRLKYLVHYGAGTLLMMVIWPLEWSWAMSIWSPVRRVLPPPPAPLGGLRTAMSHHAFRVH